MGVTFYLNWDFLISLQDGQVSITERVLSSTLLTRAGSKFAKLRDKFDSKRKQYDSITPDDNFDPEPLYDEPFAPLEPYQTETINASAIQITSFSQSSRVLSPQVESPAFKFAFTTLYLRPLFGMIIGN